MTISSRIYMTLMSAALMLPLAIGLAVFGFLAGIKAAADSIIMAWE